MGRTHSHSSLRMFSDCRRSYAFRYLEKAEVTEITSAPIARGAVVHEVIQVLYEQGRDGIVLTKEQMYDEYAKGWEPYAAPGKVAITDSYKTIDDYERGGKEMLDRFYDRFAPFRDGQLLGNELSLRFTLPGTTHLLTARIDRLAMRDDGVLEIWDYKTGDTLPSIHNRDFSHQMGMYYLAVSEH